MTIPIRATWLTAFILTTGTTVAVAQSVPGPPRHPGVALLAPRTTASGMSDHSVRRDGTPPVAHRRAGNWKGAVLIGAVAGVAFGVAVASQSGDEGSDRPFGDRLRSGALAGAMIAVPVTVIVALLTAEN